MKSSIFPFTMLSSHITIAVFAVSLLASAVFVRKLLALRAAALKLQKARALPLR